MRKIIFLSLVSFLLLLTLVIPIANAKSFDSSIKEGFKILDTTLTQTNSDEYNWGVDFNNVTSDLLNTFIGVFYDGHGNGLLEIVFNMIPIIGANPSANDLLYPLFIILFAGGAYKALQKQGYID